jgi:hypothetical protein|tara:strand:+ start:35 stop:445 length:411 start_codon:yes stop_codon:yes gene_type:complete
MTELDIWTTFNISQSAAGAHFIGVAFLIWVGLRVSNNIRNSDEANLIMKLAGTGFCVSVAFFCAMNTGWYEWNMNGAAAGLQYLSSTDVPISPGAEKFIANANPGADFNLIPDLMQGVFLASVLVMQMGQIWMPKK